MDGILKKVIWAGVLCLVLLSGCRPEGIIPPDDMVNLFTEFYEADACIETAGNRSSEVVRHIDSLRVYEPIIERYGYTRDAFLESLTYYLRKPDEITSIYDQVYERLKKRSEETEERVARLEAEEAEKNVEGKDKEDVEAEEEELEVTEPEVTEPEPVLDVRDTTGPKKPMRLEDTVKPVLPAEPVAPAVDTLAAPEKKPIRKKLTKKDLKRLEEGLK